MTDREAVERVESLADEPGSWDPGVPTPLDREALRRVLALAQRPYALGGDDRQTLQYLLDEGIINGDGMLDVVPEDVLKAVGAALALQEPLTRGK